jgi:hypothetical protein
MQEIPYWPEFLVTNTEASTIVRVLGTDGLYYDNKIIVSGFASDNSIIKRLAIDVELCKHFCHAPTGLKEIDVVSPTQESEKERIQKTYASWTIPPSAEVTVNDYTPCKSTLTN